MYKMDSLLRRLGKNGIEREVHGEPLAYRCASFAVDGLSPQSNVLYICRAGHIPRAYSDFPSCGLLIVPEGETLADRSGYQCEWCVWDETADREELLCRVQAALINGSKSARIHELKNKLTVGRQSLRFTAREVCEILGNPVAIFDESYHVLAMESLGLPVDNEVWRMAGTNGCFTPENVRIFRETIGGNDISKAPYLCTTHAWEKTHCLVMQLVSQGGALLGSIAVYESFRPFEAEDCDVIIQIAGILSAFLAASRKDDGCEGKRSALLLELIEGAQIEPGELIRRISACKWRSFALYRLGYINLSDDRTLQRQCEYFCRTLSQAAPEAIIFLRERDLVILMCADEHSAIAGMLAELEPALKSQGLSMGVSGAFFALSGLRAACGMARDALRLGQKVLGDCTIYYSQHMFFYSLLNSISSEYIQKLYSQSSYARVSEYDREHQTNYCSTLVCYFENMFKSVPTASELFIHKNSLLYRIGRVGALFGMDLNNFRDIFEFWLGYQLSIYMEYLQRGNGGEGREAQ